MLSVSTTASSSNPPRTACLAAVRSTLASTANLMPVTLGDKQSVHAPFGWVALASPTGNGQEVSLARLPQLVGRHGLDRWHLFWSARWLTA